MALSSPGIGSNIDVNGIVKQLMAVEAQPLTTLAKKEASFQAKLSAFGTVRGSLSAFQTALAGLTSPAKFQSLTATSGDATVVTGSASTTAAAGNYDINVTALAQSQTIATTGQASTTAPIGNGETTTLTFQFGTIGGGTTPTGGVYPGGTTFTQDPTQGTGSITINTSNNSLQGIRDAINKAGIGVSAAIISDGSAAPNRLVLTSTKTGATSSMRITVTGDDALEGLLAYDPASAGGQKLTESTAAKNTELTVNGIKVSSTTKTVNEAIQGVTLTALKVGNTSFTVARDTTAVTNAVNGFVKAFNDVNTTLKNMTAYNAETKVAGPLIGDASIRSIQNELRQMLNTPIPELTGNVKRMSDIGITFQKDGSLAVDATKLKNAINNNFSDIAALFSPYATTSDSLVGYVSSSSNTKAGKYAVELTAVASQGSLSGTVNLNAGAGTTTIAADTKVNVTLDGTTAEVSLVAGIYTSSEMASMVQSAINGVSAFSTLGSSVSASIDSDGHLNITSNRYGSASNVTLTGTGGTAVSAFMGASPGAQAGVDVAGKIGGTTAVGSGQHLTGASGSAADGLKLLISGGSATARGTVDFSRGYADKLNNLVTGFLSSSGVLSGRTKGINSSIKNIERTREDMTSRLEQVEKRYRAQFLALDKVISGMSRTSSYLQQQLDNLPTIE